LWSLEVDLGLVPVMPPLEPGGDYWDTAFLEATLRGLARRGQEGILDALELGAYAWTAGRSLDWGAGGPAAWPETRPYHTPEGSEDQRGLRLPEWYAAIGESACGRTMPIVVVGGGAVPPPGSDQPEVAFEQNVGVVRWLFSDEAPASLKAFAFFLLAAGPEDPEAHAAWFTAPDQPRHDVERIRQTIHSAQKRQRPKSIPHYVLMPPGEFDPALWTLAGKIAGRTRAAVGFSPEEARHAARVTVLAAPEQIPQTIADDLQRAGTRVERLDPASRQADEVIS
jgi:hypothetical protein